MKPWLYAIALSALSILPTNIDAATVLPDGTFNSSGDLTRIDDGSSVLEFLDWNVTTGQTVAAALATYASAGFSLVTGSQMASLFDAFGMTYGFTPSSYFDLTDAGYVTSTQAAAFTASVGTTLEDAALASYMEGGNIAYLCISVGTCGPNSFTNDVSYFEGDPVLGVALVRTGSVSAVPLPAGFPLVLTGIAGLAFLRRRRKSTSQA